MKVTLEINYQIGQTVYLRTDVEQLPRVVVGYCVRPGNQIIYDIQQADKNATAHSDFEISSVRDVVMTSTN